jgi:predicted RNase H-like nuclease
MAHGKKSAPGRKERLALLTDRAGFAGLEAWLGEGRPRGVAVDDALDAHVLAWAAARIARHEAQRLPEVPPRDERRLRMEIWF